MNRAARPKLRTNHPTGRIANRAGVFFLFIPRGFVDPLPEIVEALLRALDLEAETVGLVAVPSAIEAAATARLRLNEVRERNSHLDYFLAERL